MRDTIETIDKCWK